MSKRNKIVQESPESEVLKALRLKVDLSVRKLAEAMDMSKSRVHQMESGRENISQDYIQKFLDAVQLSWDDWAFQISKKDKFYGMRDKCHELLNSIEPSKLEQAHELLLGL
ncbi:MAG: hypothetical protein DRQ88_00110 [Epsilonproteobacteria bacterium]|nr:MAG: hypothetical protein DRQ89_10645 [Campylobacterota bacterium]RLA68040.1 MAG: hypothetical protein DRQ88_00110 [Campylobacterota bacterium]